MQSRNHWDPARATILAWMILLLPALAAANTYIGSAVCGGCHGPIRAEGGPKYTRWQQTNHAKIYNTNVTADKFISDWTDGQVVTLNRTSTVTVQVTLHTSPTYAVTIGGTRYPIIRVHGAVNNPKDVDPDPARAPKPGHTAFIGKQRYHVRIGNSDFILPIQWNPVADLDGKNQGWTGYNVQNWFAADGTPTVPTLDKAEARDCAGCHQTGVVPAFDGTEWTITRIEENIACEACHGPGGDHLAGGGGANIVNPSNLTVAQANDICGSCHSRGESVGQLGAKALSYPYNGTRTFLPGDALADFFALSSKPADYWGNGVSKSHHQQAHDFALSQHVAAGVRCIDCHDVHGTANEHDLRTSARNNQLCLGCHTAEFPDTAAVATHTKHDPANTASPRCVDCHMPSVQKSAVNFDIHAHAFQPLLPQDTLTYKMPSSCAICHRSAGSGPYLVDSDISRWDEPADVNIAIWLSQKFRTAVRSFWSHYR